MDPSRQHNFAPSRGPLYHHQHPPVAPPPLHIPHPAAYSVGQAMANNNIYPMTANGTHPMDGNNISPMAGPSMIPPSPSQASSVEDMSNYELPDIAPMSRKWGKYAFGLKIVQHPHRARMCGFGDKVSTKPWPDHAGCLPVLSGPPTDYATSDCSTTDHRSRY